ncbi:unnamed protein product [Bathycoccus prasinos]
MKQALPPKAYLNGLRRELALTTMQAFSSRLELRKLVPDGRARCEETRDLMKLLGIELDDSRKCICHQQRECDETLPRRTISADCETLKELQNEKRKELERLLRSAVLWGKNRVVMGLRYYQGSRRHK